MAQNGKEPDTKPKDLSSFPRIYLVKAVNQLSKVVLLHPHIHHSLFTNTTPPHTHK